LAPRPPNDTGTGGGDLSGFVAALQRALCLGAIALYGSRGRGDHFPDSDYDFVVVSSSFDGLNPLLRREKPYEAWAATGPGRGADIFGLTPQELLAMESPLIWDMLEDGRPLFDDGVWRRAVAEFHRRKTAGYIIAVPGGWKVAERPAAEEPEDR
jgi:hypothetical protein